MTREERERRADARAERRVYLQEMRLEETRKRTWIQQARFAIKVGPWILGGIGIVIAVIGHSLNIW